MHIRKLIKEGTRVHLRSFDNGDFVVPEQVGTALEAPSSKGMFIVEVDQQYRSDDDQDGLVEAHWTQVKEILK